MSRISNQLKKTCCIISLPILNTYNSFEVSKKKRDILFFNVGEHAETVKCVIDSVFENSYIRSCAFLLELCEVLSFKKELEILFLNKFCTFKSSK